MKNISPWLSQLKRTREAVALSGDADADVVIVGAGIAGIMTAYFTLRDTDKNVMVLESDKVAHGATGHNAGQITSYFERPLGALVEEYGLDLASRGQESVESAWNLLEQVHAEAKLATKIYRFTGHAGIRTLDSLLVHLDNNYYRAQSGRLDLEGILVAEEADYIKKIPPKYVNLYAMVPKADVLSLLETKNSEYTAVVSYEKGCANSALLCEELAGYMIATYRDRFVLHEQSPVATLTLGKSSVSLTSLGHTVHASDAVLCTNGFENFTIATPR